MSNEIAQILCTRMNRRGLWTMPCEWLGYSQWNSWDEDGAFEQITSDCYEFVCKAIKQSENIDGKIFRSINNFLIGRLKKYTPLVRALRKNYCWQPDLVFQQLLKKITQDLRAEMRRRHLGYMPPAMLGYPQWDNWDEKADKRGLRAPPSAFNDLAFDCYVFCIYERFPYLIRAVKKGSEIDGLVRRNVKVFISEQQKKYDPLGYAIYKNVIGATYLVIDEAIIISNMVRVSNKTLLTFSKYHPTKTLSSKNELLLSLRANKAWSDIKLKLIRQSKIVQKDLSHVIAQLDQFGIKKFFFKDLVSVMKENIIIEWYAVNWAQDYEDMAIFDDEDDDNTLQVEKVEKIEKIIQPDTTYEDLESWREGVSQIEEAIKQSGYQKRVRERLPKLFAELVRYAETDKEEPLSQIELAKRLGVAVGTINADMNRLRQLLRPR